MEEGVACLLNFKNTVAWVHPTTCFQIPQSGGSKIIKKAKHKQAERPRTHIFLFDSFRVSANFIGNMPVHYSLDFVITFFTLTESQNYV